MKICVKKLTALLAGLGLSVSVWGALISPDAVSTTMGELSEISTLINGSNLDTFPLVTETSVSIGSGWASAFVTTGSIVFDFSAPVFMDGMYLWQEPGANSYDVKGFGFFLFDSPGGSAGGGSQIGSSLSNTAVQGDAAQGFFITPTPGVQSVEMMITSNYGAPLTGLNEVAFSVIPEPATICLFGISSGALLLCRRIYG